MDLLKHFTFNVMMLYRDDNKTGLAETLYLQCDTVIQR